MNLTVDRVARRYGKTSDGDGTVYISSGFATAMGHTNVSPYRKLYYADSWALAHSVDLSKKFDITEGAYFHMVNVNIPHRYGAVTLEAMIICIEGI